MIIMMMMMITMTLQRYCIRDLTGGGGEAGGRLEGGRVSVPQVYEAGGWPTFIT